MHGPKDVENRNQAWKYRGRILVHASLTIDHVASAELRRQGVRVPEKCVLARDAANGAQYADELVAGGIIGRADIVDCVHASSSPWFFGPNGLVLEQRAPLPFFKCRGHIGLQRPAPEILAFYEGLV